MDADPWATHAACAGEDPDVFFPTHYLAMGNPHGRGRREHPSVTRAKVICAGCPVRQPCLDEALDRRIEHGIWGGTTPEERRALRGSA